MIDGNRSYVFHLKDHFFIVLASIECSLVSCSSCFFHWLINSFIHGESYRAHKCTFPCGTSIQLYLYYIHSIWTQEKYRAHKCTFFPLVHQYSHFCWQYCRVGIGRFNRLDKLRLIHKADFIDSWEDMSGKGISESSESAKYKSQLFRHSCQTTLFIGRNEMLLSNWKGFVSWTTHSGCQTLKGRSKAFRKIK